ncbi:hypothetical protein HMPREF3186_01756, partial [Gemella haemolysans]
KYLNGFEKKKPKNKTSKLDKYCELIKSLLSSSTQTFSYIRVLRQYLEDNYEINTQLSITILEIHQNFMNTLKKREMSEF